MTFEESAKMLTEMAEKIKDENITLQEAIKCYEEGVKRYEECNKILKEAKQKIEVYEEGV
ncbi:MAG: exodeoxyribonuclease VII small subunit [Clostridiales bacterium]|nr:exodeoxyribonuclease VII small subunit [Bacillota bacterium]MEE0517655.1 exodeoxyribonuclease VII small subunit [Anaerovoracaceae bacterium]PWL94632.1 MAG: exodeoxyribonuclease VII small subunit [Clostridiales bacterium]